MDIQASNTVGIKVLTFLVCYIPATLYSAWGDERPNLRYNRWPGFLAQFCVFISIGINPVIYSFRTRRFRSVLKQLLKDPCGRRPFQESNEGKQGPRGIPFKMTKKVGVSNEITHQPDEPNITCRGWVENANGKCHERSCEEARSNETKGQSRLHGRGVQLGWVESKEKLADFKGATVFDDESPPPSGNNSRQEVTVEVHQDHSCSLRESFKKNGSCKQGPKSREECNMQEVTLEKNNDKGVQKVVRNIELPKGFTSGRYITGGGGGGGGGACPDPNDKK